MIFCLFFNYSLRLLNNLKKIHTIFYNKEYIDMSIGVSY